MGPASPQAQLPESPHQFLTRQCSATILRLILTIVSKLTLNIGMPARTKFSTCGFLPCASSMRLILLEPSTSRIWLRCSSVRLSAKSLITYGMCFIVPMPAKLTLCCCLWWLPAAFLHLAMLSTPYLTNMMAVPNADTSMWYIAPNPAQMVFQ